MMTWLAGAATTAARLTGTGKCHGNSPDSTAEIVLVGCAVVV